MKVQKDSVLDDDQKPPSLPSGFFLSMVKCTDPTGSGEDPDTVQVFLRCT